MGVTVRILKGMCMGYCTTVQGLNSIQRFCCLRLQGPSDSTSESHLDYLHKQLHPQEVSVCFANDVRFLSNVGACLQYSMCLSVPDCML